MPFAKVGRKIIFGHKNFTNPELNIIIRVNNIQKSKFFLKSIVIILRALFQK